MSLYLRLLSYFLFSLYLIYIQIVILIFPYAFFISSYISVCFQRLSKIEKYDNAADFPSREIVRPIESIYLMLVSSFISTNKTFSLSITIIPIRDFKVV